MSNLLLILALVCQDSPARPRKAFVDMRADGTISVEKHEIGSNDLSARLKSLAGSGIRELALRADGAVPFSSVQAVMAVAKEAGIEAVQFTSDLPMPTVKFAEGAGRQLRVKVREGGKGLEIVLLQENGVASIEELKKQLREMEKRPVVIDADFEAPYGAVREIVAALTEQGFDKVSFAGSARMADPLRVLYAECAPRWEFRHVRSLLERSGEAKLDVFLESADAGVAGTLAGFPADLSPYDAVLMGGLESLDADRRAALEAYVKGGGAVVWMAPEGDEWLGDAMAAICPVTAKRGEAAALVLEPKDGAPPLRWADLSGKAHSAWTSTADADARVLVASNRGAFLATQTVGKGRAAYVGAVDTWRWREGTGDKPHFASFWLAILKSVTNR